MSDLQVCKGHLNPVGQCLGCELKKLEQQNARYRSVIEKMLEELERLCDSGWNPEIKMLKDALQQGQE